ncbi:uncharacterized protein K02A2.6-like [Ornithodoros turicata]|uniref:uncharacterized protein K02A2.6-like n=1 Tax=Ornithodoros turicata TaxID=34597 RepID=UPI003139D834
MSLESSFMSSSSISSIAGLRQPAQFNFIDVTDWPAWRDEFEDYLYASGTQDKPGEVKVRTLLYCMGRKAREILRTFNLSEEETKDYGIVLEKFNAHFTHSRNTVYETANFSRRQQNLGETVDAYLVELHKLAEKCDFGLTKERMIRDRFVVGLIDTKLSQSLQMDSSLTLQSALTKARLKEAVVKQQSELGKKDLVADTVGCDCRCSKPALTEEFATDLVSRQEKRDRRGVDSRHSCAHCGYRHPQRPCPARNKECLKCCRVGHFAKMCHTSLPQWEKPGPRDYRRNFVSEVTLPENDFFLGTVAMQTPAPVTREVEVRVNDVPLLAKIDSGADVTVVGSGFPGLPDLLEPPDTLKGPSGTTLDVLGKFRAVIQWKKKTTSQMVYVVHGLRKPLLGLPALLDLEIIRFLNEVEVGEDHWSTRKFPELFRSLGKIPGEYVIRLQENCTPFAIAAPRRVPFAMRTSVKTELDNMEKQGVIRKIHTPTDWCAPIVLVKKPSGKIRICVDLTKLNECVKRERLILPTVEEVLGSIGPARFFTKLDANSGFYQIMLSEKSQELTTFITPFGRYCFQRLPFGITSAPEVFQRKIAQVLDDLPGVLNLMDDILIYGDNREEHDRRLNAVLQRLSDNNVTLNLEKCKFFVEKISFLGVLIDQHGIYPDPRRVEALTALEPPQNVSDLRRILGMFNHVGRFIPNMSTLSAPLRELLVKNVDWYWGNGQQDAFQRLKASISSGICMAKYNPNLPTILSADASSYGLGAVLLQVQQPGDRKPVAYASRSLNSAETRYSQMEKEALALTWAAEKFDEYICGLRCTFETDHKPLVSLLGLQQLDQLPLRIQRFRLRLMRYDYDVTYVPGASMTIADALSRSPLKDTTSSLTADEVSAFVRGGIEAIPDSDKLLDRIREFQKKDEVCSTLREYCKTGWPPKGRINQALRPYYEQMAKLSVCEDVLLCGQRIVIPMSLREEILGRIHEGHQGIVRCRQKAKESIWWPGISKELADLVRACSVCEEYRLQPSEPMIPTETPPLPSNGANTTECSQYL